MPTNPLQPSNPRKPGRPALPTAFYSMVAELYAEAEAMGTNAPAQWVGRRMSQVLQREVKESTARRWVMKARQRGLLPPAPTRQQEPKPKPSRGAPPQKGDRHGR